MAATVTWSDLNRGAVREVRTDVGSAYADSVHVRSCVTSQVNGMYVSASDHRSYRPFTLPNGLRAVVVSDRACRMASAAVHVCVGSSADPDEVHGLAHFLEHMLFLGTEKYPDENSYSEFLHDHGGMSNAYTSADGTNYHFEVSPAHLSGALDRFAAFFTCPMLTESATARELKAVDAEHAKNQQSDAWRLYQLMKSTSHPAHPFAKFGTGDSRTLSVIPAEKGINVREHLLRFHAQHYSAGRISLVVYGSDSLDDMEAWVREKFSGVPNNGSAPAHHALHPFDGCTGTRMLVVPVKDMRSLRIEWAIGSQTADWRAKSSRYLSHLMGHEGEGSILSHLKARGWATDLSSGDMNSHPDWASFGVYIGLSEVGLDHIDEIIDVVYSYVGMLRAVGPQAWVWQEMCTEAAASCRYASFRGGMDFASSLASEMADLPTELAPVASSLHFGFDPAGVSALLERFVPENARVMVVAKAFESQATESERWYGTQYVQRAESPDTLHRWTAAAAQYAAFTAARMQGGTAAHGLDASAPLLRLPAPNEFLATDFELRHPKFAGRALEEITQERSGDDEEAALLEPVPTCIEESAHAWVWWHADDHFAVPKVYSRFDVAAAQLVLTPRHNAMSDVFMRLLKESLNEYAYAASVAGLQYDVEQAPAGIHIQVGGFSHKAATLAAKVAERMVALTFTDQQFVIEKDKAVRALENWSKEQPYKHAMIAASLALSTPRYDIPSRLKELRTVTADELRAFCTTAFERTHVTAFISGNVSREEAHALAQSVLTPLRACGHPLALADRRIQRVVKLPTPVRVVSPTGATVTVATEVQLQLPAQNAADPNNAAHVTIQLGPRQRGKDCRSNALASLAGHLLAEPFFDDLRTKQQLGYIVNAGVRDELLVQDLRFLVQSNKVSAREIVDRVEAFVAAFPAHVEAMPAERFAANVQALIAQCRDGPKNLRDLAWRTWLEVRDGVFDFKRSSNEIAALERITQADMVAWLRERLHPASELRRVFVSTVQRSTDAKVDDALPGDAADDDGDDADAAEQEGSVPPSNESNPEVVQIADASPAVSVPSPTVRTAHLSASVAAISSIMASLDAVRESSGTIAFDDVMRALAEHGIAFDDNELRAVDVIKLEAATDDPVSVRSVLPLFPPFGIVHSQALRSVHP